MNELELLQYAATEIKSLRRQNELMNARLEMFDNMMAVLHTTPASKYNGGMSPDIVYEIDKYITSQPKQETL